MLKRFFITVLGTMTGFWLSIVVMFFALLLSLGVALGKSSSESTVKIEKKTVLSLDLSGVIEDRYQPTSFIQLIQESENSGSATLEEMLVAIDNAADDERIEGLYINCGGAAMGMAAREELIEAIGRFKEKGKWVYAYADAYGQGDYLVASTADTVVLNPIGAVDIHGIASITPFFKELLDKLGVKMQIVKVGTYKSAVEPYILSEMSEPARRQLQQYVDSLWSYYTETVGNNRGIATDSITAMASTFIGMREAPTFMADGLVDTLLYSRSIDARLKTLAGLKEDDDARFVGVSEYAASYMGKESLTKKHIAVLYAVGEISDSGKEGIVGQTMVDEIVDLADNDKVRGLVFRVNSPGGSAFASEQIWEAIEYFKSKNKPVYVSMGDYAASGGYYISCAADSIFADRTTLTGSIGVFGMIPDLSGLVTDKLGVNFSTVESNPNAGGITGFEPMTAAQHAALQTSVDNIYELFTRRVAEGRGMEQDSVKAIAEGRVWVAGDALRLGLIDAIGSLHTTVGAMADYLGMSTDDVRSYPDSKQEFWEKFLLENTNIDQMKAAGYDAGTIHLLDRVQRLRTAAPVQARMIEVEVK